MRINLSGIVDQPFIDIAPGIKLPSGFTADIYEYSEGLGVKVQVDVSTGVPRAIEVTIRAAKGVDCSALRLPLQQIVDQACTATLFIRIPDDARPDQLRGFAVEIEDEGGFIAGNYQDRINYNEGAEHVRSRTRRRTIDDDFLRAFADAYRDGGMRAVRVRWPSSASQAYRYRTAAVERGFLGEDEL